MKCPNCEQNTLMNTALGEVCSNEECGYIDGIVLGPKKKRKKLKRTFDGLTNLKQALDIIEEQEKTIVLLQKQLWTEQHASCVHCGRGPSHPADGC